MEFVFPGVVLGTIAIVWGVGYVRQRGVRSDQRRLVADLEGERVEVEFVVSLAPLGYSARITALAEARLVGLRRRRRSWSLQVVDATVDDTVLAGTVLADGDAVEGWITREGIALDDVISITTSDGERHAFFPEPRGRR